MKTIKSSKKLKKAIAQIEYYIADISPKNIQDIKTATKDISTAALGAYLSVHSKSEAVSFINQLSINFIDTTDNKNLKYKIHIFDNYSNNIH